VDILEVSGTSDPGSIPGGGIGFIVERKHIYNFLKSIKLSNITVKEMKAIESRLMQFLEACSYRINDDRIIIYINELKTRYSPVTVRKHIITIKRFLKFVEYPTADQIKIPKIPRRRKIVIKVKDVRELLKKADLKTKAAILLCATSGLRAQELYKLTLDDIDIENRTIYVRAEITKDYEDRITFFSEEAREALLEYLNNCKRQSRYLFPEGTMLKKMRKISSKWRIKHMRKFFSQQSDRLGMPTAIKKILMGHVVGDEEFVIPRGSDIDLSHYDFQDEEELKKIYDKYWRDFRILD